MKLRSLVDLNVKRIDFVDDGFNGLNDTHLDRRRLCCCLEILAQLAARRTVERLSHIVVKAGVIDIEACHGKAWHAAEAMLEKALKGVPVLRRKFLEYNQ